VASPDLLRRQVTLVGSWTFSKQGQAECAEFIADRKVDVERLFTHRWRLEQAEEAYRLSTRRRPARPSSCRPDPQGCGPHGAAVRSLTSCEATSERNLTAKPDFILLPITDE
jgi:hypothetical protein